VRYDILGGTSAAEAAIAAVRTGDNLYPKVDQGQVAGAPAANQFNGNLALSAQDDFYKTDHVRFTSGILTGESREIADYTAATRTFQFSTPFSAAPSSGDSFDIVRSTVTFNLAVNGLTIPVIVAAGNFGTASALRDHIQSAVDSAVSRAGPGLVGTLLVSLDPNQKVVFQAVGPTSVTVNNVAPSFNSVSNSAYTEGAVLAPNTTVTVDVFGPIFDLGSLDPLSLTVDWGDGSAVSTSTVAAGSSGLSLDHDYVRGFVYEIIVTLADDDGGQVVGQTTAFLNESPYIISSYFVEVAENQTAAIDVESSDPDGQTEGAGLTYSLTGGADQDLFSINSNTGVLTFKTAPNFEIPGDVGANNVYDVQVTVTDAAGFTDLQDFAVTVRNVNESPSITSAASVNVPENQTAVIDVESSDPDGETDADFYDLTGGADKDLFSIDRNNGVLRFKTAPDFEIPGDFGANNVYDVQITATDGEFTAVQNLAVTVTDGNDAPRITSVVVVDVAENQTAVFDVESSDPEGETEGNGLTYSLVSAGVDEGRFSIVAATGVVTFKTAPNFESPGDFDGNNSYLVAFLVTDSAGSTGRKNGVVRVTNVNESPSITSAASVNASENQTAVIDVQSSDPDGQTEGAGLTYSLTGGADQILFSVNATTGVLTFNAAPDFENPGDADANNVYNVQVTVTDAAGLTGVQNLAVTVTLSDTTAPTFSPALANQTVEATGPSGAAVNFTATAIDAVDTTPTVNCNPASGTTFPLGVTTVECTATDDAGNSRQGSFTVTVRDTTAPTFSPALANQTVEATGPSGAAVNFTTTATDAVDATPTVNCNPASGTTYPLGVTTVQCTATDDAGNSAQGSFTVTVRDTTAPTFSPALANQTVEATGPSGAAVNFTATATDAVDPTPTVNCNPASGTTYPLGVTTVQCTATDDAGNSRQGSFTVTVRDTTAPTFSPALANQTVEATSPSGAAVNFTATATDAVDATPTVNCNPASGSAYPLGVTTVQCTATDDAGNSRQGSFTVTVRDTTAPTFSPALVNLTVAATSSAGAVVNFTATAIDTVDTSATVTCDHSSGETFPAGVTTVNCTATDDGGNSRPGSFTVTVADTTSPTITNLQLVPVGKKIGRVVLTFSEDVVNAAVASNYSLVSQHNRGSKPVPISSLGSAVYSSIDHTLTFTPAKPAAAKKLSRLRLTVLGTGTLADRAGNRLDGDADGQTGGNCTTGVVTQTNPCATSRSAIQSATDELLSSRATPHSLRSEKLVDDFLRKTGIDRGHRFST